MRGWIMMAVAPMAPAALAAPAAAQTGIPGVVTVDGVVGVASDYRFRGLSRSDGDPAAQGGATLTLRAGPYAGVWASTIGRYVAGGGDPEIDAYAGFRRSLGGTTLDGGLLYYAYPGSGGNRGARGRASFEPYLSLAHTLGPVTAKLGGNYAWRQRSLALGDGRARSGAYAYGELAAGIPTTPLTLTLRLGHAFEANQATLGRVYTDWGVRLAYVRRRLTLSAGYVDTDTSARPYGRGDVAGATLVGTAALGF